MNSGTESAPRATHRPTRRELGIGLVLAVVLVFGHGMYNEFVQWDDPINLMDNPHFRGLGWEQLRWMLTATLMGHYIPLTWLTFGLDYVLWGMEPSGYHFTNIVLHAANVVLFFVLAGQLLARALPWATAMQTRVGAVFAALFFGIHPLRAESVAWATERRDVLSGLFFLACVLVYVHSTEAQGRRRRLRLGLALVLFALALLSKSIVMTLPVALIILDLYPLRRLPMSPREWLRPSARPVLIEKIPFLAVGVVGAFVSYWAVGKYAFFTSTVQYPLVSRVAMALYSVCFYVAKTVLPIGLSPLYELPARVDPLDGPFALGIVASLFITVSLLLLSRRWPAGCAAYLYYAIVIAPVGGLVHAGFQLAHDRYSYLSCLGFALLVGGVPALLGRAREQGRLSPALVRTATAAMAAWIVALGLLAADQVRVWRTTESLWIHATIVEPECSICHNNVAALLVNQGNPRAALIHLGETLRIRPDREKAHGGVGLALIQLRRYAEAEPHLLKALDKDPKDGALLNNVGTAILRQDHYEKAIPYLRRSLVANDKNVAAHVNLGVAYAGAGRLQDALRVLQHAVGMDQYAAEPRVALTRAYLQTDNRVEARKHYTILRQLHPKAAEPFAADFRG